MSAAAYFNGSVATMSNYSVYFLRQNAHLDINCLVYSLNSGLLLTQDYFTGLWLDNTTDFLPAYYVANCLVPDLLDQIASQNVSLTDIESWLAEYMDNPYNEADNGDSFVALLFMLVGLCVLGWMLLLLFLLLPKHKQKPVLTQLAVLFYLVYLTVIFSRVSQITRSEYYADLLDMVKILLTIADQRYAALLLVLSLLTQLAYLELMLKMTKHRWKVANCAWVALLIVACLVTGACFVPLTEDSYNYVTLPASSLALALLALDVVFMAWFAACLGYHTTLGTATPPKQVAYSKKLLPLALLTWFFVETYLVLTVLLALMWREDWLTNAWLSYMPKLLAMYILTASWEWVYSIRHLESQLELVDMLGRRISLEDVMDLSNDAKVRRTALRGRFAPVLDFFGRARGHVLGDKDSAGSISSGASLPAVVDCGMVQEDGAFASEDNESSEYEVQYMDTNSWDDGHREQPSTGVPVVALAEDTETQHGQESMSLARLPDVPSPRHSILRQENAAVVGGSSVAHPTEGSSRKKGDGSLSSLRDSQEELPPFCPHPGFSKDDYWDEK